MSEPSPKEPLIPGPPEPNSSAGKTSGPRYGLELVLGIIALIGAFFSRFLWMENRYALNPVVKKIEKRLDLKIIDDQLQNAREEIWKHEDRLNISPDDATVEF